jgi:putative nucleotidyltransferase with HDIG domain
MPDHIQAHSRMVCRVALVLADSLSNAGLSLQRDLIRAAAILHDITKIRSFKTGEYHAQTGGQYLAELGFFEVGEIVRQHVELDIYRQNTSPCEAEVVNYADKRVLEDHIVSLDQRMQYIEDRYAKTEAHKKHLRVLWDKTRQLEKRLFGYLDFAPEELEAHPDLSPEY